MAYFDELQRPRWVGRVLAVERIERVLIAGGYPPDGPRDDASLSLVTCHVAPRVTCRQALIAGGVGPNDASVGLLATDPTKLRARPRSWLWERTPYLLPTGHVRLGACRGGHGGETAPAPCPLE